MKRFASALLALLLTLTLVVPNLTGLAWAASRPSEDNIADRPEGADVFFDSANEAYSFNTASYWDLYQTQLGVKVDGYQDNPNGGLILSSSTDGALVQKGGTESAAAPVQYSTTMTIKNGGWNTFSWDSNVAILENVQLAQGDNDIKIEVPANVRGLAIYRGNERIAVIEPDPNKRNVQSSKNGNSGADYNADKANSWAEGVSGATYDINGFGWMDNGAVVYHFKNLPAAGTYTLKLQCAQGTGSDRANAKIVATVGDTSASQNGVLRIDYESAPTFTYKQYGNENTVFDYSDGSATVVGWGGTVKARVAGDRDRLAISLKVVNGPELSTLAEYLKLYAVDSSGKIKYSGTLADMKGAEPSTSFLDGYTTYFSQYNANLKDSEGIKLIFDTPDGKDDISGTVEVGFVGLYKGSSQNANEDTIQNPANWTSVSPFNYSNAVVHTYEEHNIALDAMVKPFLRIPGNTTNQQFSGGKYTWNGTTYTKGGDGNENNHGTISGCNISDIDWHLWTMSTSDANIVDDDHADKNGTGTFNALEIKYRKDGDHETFAALTGAKGHSGQWLAITVKGEDLAAMQGTSKEDLGEIRIVLKNDSNVVATVALKDFQTASTQDAPKIDLSALATGYRTLYYHLGTTNNQITTVEFNFSQVKNAEAGSDAHRVYVKDIYLFNPKLTILKNVDRATAAPGDELTYTLTVKNESGSTYSSGYTVTDTLPDGLTYVENTQTTSGEAYFQHNGQRLSWAFKTSLDADQEVTITFKATINADAVDGRVYANMALVDNVKSNEVITRVEDHTQYSKVFYAQVGQKTTLNLDLGQSMVDTTETVPQPVKKEYTIIVQRSTASEGGSGNATIKVEIPDGAEVRLYGPTDGGFIFSRGSNNEPSAVQIGNQSWNLNRNSDGTYTNFSVYSTMNFHSYEASDSKNPDGPNYAGPLSSFVSAENYVVLNDVTQSGTQSITLNLQHMWAPTKEFKVVVCYTDNVEQSGPQKQQDNTFNSIENPSENAGFTVIPQDGAVGMRKLSLSYTSTETGTKTFNVRVNVGGGSETKDVQVTVYNYNVQDHTYVLDYGLPVYLTGKGTEGTQDIADYSGTKLLNGDANDGLHFFGVSGKKNNTDSIADSLDYQHTNYEMAGGQGVQFQNGVVTSTFGEVNETKQSIKYTPTRFMDSADVFYYGVQVQKNGTSPDAVLDATNATPVMEGKITVVPASIVYYEDNFSKSGTGADGDNGILYGGSTTSSGENDGRMQSNDLDLRYGYDEAYENDAEYSGGSATKMEAGSYAMFQFKGTGIDIISSTADNTGTVFVYVFDDAKIGENGKIVADGESTPQLVDMQIVNTYYENNDTQGLYQIPVVNVRGLKADKTHVVKIVVSNVGKKNSVYLDGLRIYNPLANGDTYYIESEKCTKILELRDMILGSGYTVSYDENGNATLATEGTDVQASLVQFGTSNTFLSGATVTENFTGAYYNNGVESKDVALTANMLSYLLQGPNNEVYLSSGYGVAFYVEGNGTLQIAAKKLMGRPNLQYRNNAGNWIELDTNKGGSVDTATEMYYEIPLDQCQSDGDSKHLVVLRVGNGVVDAGKPTDVMSLTYLKASAGMGFSSVKGQITSGETQTLDWAKIETVSNPGKNNRKTITFATDADVIDVKVMVAGAEVTATAASYVFNATGTKTWVVTYDASQNGNYTVELIRATGAANAGVN